MSVFCIVPRDCADVYKSGRHRNGIYTIDPDGEGPMEVFCDQVSAHVEFIPEKDAFQWLIRQC